MEFSSILEFGFYSKIYFIKKLPVKPSIIVFLSLMFASDVDSEIKQRRSDNSCTLSYSSILSCKDDIKRVKNINEVTKEATKKNMKIFLSIDTDNSKTKTDTNELYQLMEPQSNILIKNLPNEINYSEILKNSQNSKPKVNLTKDTTEKIFLPGLINLTRKFGRYLQSKNSKSQRNEPSKPEKIIEKICNLIKYRYDIPQKNEIDYKIEKECRENFENSKIYLDEYLRSEIKTSVIVSLKKLYEDIIIRYQKIYCEKFKLNPSESNGILVSLLNDLAIQHRESCNLHYKSKLDYITLKILENALNYKLSLENIIYLHQILIIFYYLRIIENYNSDVIKRLLYQLKIFNIELLIPSNIVRIESSYSKKSHNDGVVTFLKIKQKFPGSHYIETIKENEYIEIIEEIKRKFNGSLETLQYKEERAKAKNKIRDSEEVLKKIVYEKSSIKITSDITKRELMQLFRYYEFLMKSEEAERLKNSCLDIYDGEKQLENYLNQKMNFWFESINQNNKYKRSLNINKSEEEHNKITLLTKIEFLRMAMERFKEKEHAFVSQNKYIFYLSEKIVNNEIYKEDVMELEVEIEKLLLFESS